MTDIHPINIHNPKQSVLLRELQTLSYRREAELIGFHGIPQIEESHEALIASGADFYGFWSGGRLAGAIALSHKDGLNFIDRLVVHPDFFRQGIGRALVEMALGLHPGAEYRVSTGTLNEPAVQLYQSFGFKEAEVIEIALGVTITRFIRLGL